MKNFLLLIMLFTSSLTWAQQTKIYVSDGGNFNNPPWQILKYDADGSNPLVFINTNLAWPQDIRFLESQSVVLISNLNTNRISRFDSDTGVYIDEFATGISGPTRMKIGPDGMLYALQWSGNGLVKRYQLDGTFVDDFTDTPIPQSIGLDWDTDGNLYVSSYQQDNVTKFDPQGNKIETFISSSLTGPTNIWFDPSGDLLVSDYDGGSIKRFDPTGTYQEVYISGLSAGEGIDFLPNGNLLVGNGGTSAVKMYDSNGTFIEDIVPSGSGGLILPNAVRVRTSTSSSKEVKMTDAFLKNTVGQLFHLHPNKGSVSYTVVNVQGHQVISSDNPTEDYLDLSHLPLGIYLIIARTDDRVISQKILRSH